MKNTLQTPKTAIEAPKIEPATPENTLAGLISAFEAADAALHAAETALRNASARATDLELTANQLDGEAAEADRQRGYSLSRGEMAEAKSAGQRFAAAHDGAKSCRLEAAALRAAIPGLECDTLVAEERALAAHRAVHWHEHDHFRATIVADLAPKLLRLWRSYCACGQFEPIEDFAKRLANDALPQQTSGYSLLPIDPLPITEDEPYALDLLGRRNSDRRYEISTRREAMQAAA